MNGKGITVVTTAGPLRASAIGNALSLVGVVTDAAMLNISPGVVDGSVLATALSEGGSFSFVVPGTYTLTSQQSIPSNCTINVGPGVILDATSMSTPCFTATSKSNIRLTGDGIIRCVAASAPSFTDCTGLEVSVRIEDASGTPLAWVGTGNTERAERGRSPANTLVVIGDSLASRSYVTSGNNVGYGDHSSVTWAQALSGQKLDYINLTAATGGSTTTDWLTRIGDEVLAFSPGWCDVILGTNDISGDIAYATIVSNLEKIYEAIRRSGAKLVVYTIPPYGSGYSVIGDSLAVKNARRDLVNQWICSYASESDNVYVVDSYAAIIDPTSATGLARSTHIDTDGLHLSAHGSRAVGVLRAAITTRYCTDAHFHASSYVDSYDYDTASKNRVSNPMMLSSGGTTTQGTGTTLTGTTVPASWTAFTTSGGTCTAVFTTEDRTIAADGDANGKNVKIVVSGTNATDLVSLRTGSISTRFSAGDIAYGEMFIRIVSATALEGVRLLATTTVGGTTYNYTGMSAQATTYDQSDSGVLVIRTPEFTWPSGAISSTILTLDILFNGAGGATVYIGRASWRKVN